MISKIITFLSFFAIINVLNGLNLIVKLNIEDKNGQKDPYKISNYWSQNDNSNRFFNLKLTLSIESSNETNVILNQPASITIKCIQKTDTSDLFGSLSITDTSISDLKNSKSVQIQFRIVNEGQSPFVSCTGQVNSFSPQNFLNLQLNQIVFVQSPNVRFEIQSYPTISFVKDSKTTLEISPFLDSQFNIFFRDTTLFSTEITCSITGNVSPLPLILSTSPIQVSTGQNVAQIRYSVSVNNVQDLQSVLNLRCSAQSLGVTGIEQQYQTAIATASINVVFKKPQIDVSTNSLRMFGTQFRLPIKLNPTKKASNDVTVQCDLKKFKTFNQLQTYQNSLDTNTCPNSLTNTIETNFAEFTYNNTDFDFYFIEPSNSSLFTKVKDFKFDNSDNIIYIEQRPKLSLKSSLTLYLSLFCCDNSISNTIKYQPYVSKVTVSLSKSSDPATVYPTTPSNDDLMDPKYNPCTCDVTVNSCDFNCCCDKTCTESDRNATKQVCPTQVRNVFEKTIDKWTCNDIYNNQRQIENDWFPIICIQFNTTVLLGNFYSPGSLNDYILNQNEKFTNEFQQKVKQSYNYRSRYLNDPLYDQNGLTSSPYCTLDQTTYKIGSCIQQTEDEQTTIASDFFRFPLSTNSYQSCLYNSPVKFLFSEERNFCPITINSDCNDKNLNFQNYINKIIISKNDKIKLSDTVEYFYCPTTFSYQTTPSTLTPFTCPSNCDCNFNSNTKIFDNIFTCKEAWSEPSNSINLDQINLDYYLKPNSACRKLTQTEVNSLSITQTGGKCTNILAGIIHLIFWRGNLIKKILTRVILTDITYPSKNFKQMFEIKWVNLPNTTTDVFNLDSILSVSEYDDLIQGQEYLKILRSGKKGYVIGKPLISGILSNGKWDVSYKNRFSTFRTLNGKLCGLNNQQERVLVNFGQNISSSCIVQVTKQDLINEGKCASLRKIMFEKLNDYFAPSNRISKNGNPNLINFNETIDWLKVFPESRNLVLNNGSNSDGFSTCLQVPYKINLWFFYGDVGKQNGELIKEILGVYVAHSYRDWSFVCKGNTKECEDSNLAQDFTIEFEANFINGYKKNLTWFESCKSDKYPSDICIEQVLWTWPTDQNDPDFFYLYTVHMGLIFGVLSIVVIHFMLFGFVCPC
ncbi:unnamed protein product [Brachionus calyciflorus]|uniref:Tectonic-1-3 N-terminal domain-containing protein n=1 Tax=Brachionus calyciflorus TaxID=104777 RepID=A0A813VYQ5_9BILA|nr:unnamed protein product [Brachionus calyciflorus]